MCLQSKNIFHLEMVMNQIEKLIPELKSASQININKSKFAFYTSNRNVDLSGQSIH